MTPAQKRKGLISKIHIAKQQLGMDDDTYRAVLQRTTGQRSCTQCDLSRLQRILAEMQRLGFVPTRTQPGRRPLHLAGVSAQMNKLEVLLRQAGKTWAYADGMAQRMFQKPAVNRLDADQLRRLIAALNYHCIRKNAQAIKQA